MSLSAYRAERVEGGVRITTSPAPIPWWIWVLMALIAVFGVVLFFIPTIIAIVSTIVILVKKPDAADFFVDRNGITINGGRIDASSIAGLTIGNTHDNTNPVTVSMFGGGYGVAGAGMAIGTVTLGSLHNALNGAAWNAGARQGFFVTAQTHSGAYQLCAGLEADVAAGVTNEIARALRGGFSSQAQSGGLVFR